MEHPHNLFEPLALLFGVLGGRDRTRSPPAEHQTVQSTANRLSAHEEGSLSKQLQHHKKRATPARAQPTVLGWRPPFNQHLDPPQRRFGQKRPWASVFPIPEGRLPLAPEAAGDRVDGGAQTEKDPGDVSRRVAIGGKQHNVHPQPTAGFSLALHILTMSSLCSSERRAILCIRALAPCG